MDAETTVTKPRQRYSARRVFLLFLILLWGVTYTLLPPDEESWPTFLEISVPLVALTLLTAYLLLRRR